MSETTSIPILMIGLEERAAAFVESHLPGANVTRIVSVEGFEAAFESWGDGMFAAIFSGPAILAVKGVELGQVLLNQCPATPKFFVTFDSTNFAARDLVKNGFSDVFLLPIDQVILKTTLTERVLSTGKERSFRPVRIFDLAPGTVLEFDTYVFLPLNNKYVKFTSANEALDPTKFAKLGERNFSSVFVDHKDMEKFYAYAGNQLRALQAGDGVMSNTERQERLRGAIRELFSDIFDVGVKADFDQGRAMIENAMKIISSYITKGASAQWYLRLLSAMGETDNDTYNHATNVSTFAALFAIGLGHKAPEDLAMAGLFHDIGMTTLPDVIAEKPEDELTDMEKILYYGHPEKSVNLIKGKRLIVTVEVERAILQHHEQFSGRGYPKQLPGARISTEAQILSFADQFDELTRIVHGKTRPTPLQAWEQIKQTGSIDPEILTNLRRLLVPDGTVEVAAQRGP